MGSTALFFHAEGDYLYLDRIEHGDRINKRPWPVELTRTQTSFGAERMWFCCPMCGKVVRKLYLPPRGFDFGCRSCHSLSYASRQTRAWEDIVKEGVEREVESRLVWERGLVEQSESA